MKTWTRWILLLSLCVTAPAMADSPASLPIQGMLSDDAGTPVNDIFAVTFTIYSDAAGTASLWSEEVPVNFVGGHFTAYLGSSTAMDLGIFRDNSELYLGIQVGDDEEMQPFALATSPYAGFAQFAGRAEDLSDSAKLGLVEDVFVQLENESKVHDKYTDQEAVLALDSADAYVSNTGDTIDGDLTVTGSVTAPNLVRIHRSQTSTGRISNNANLPGSITFEGEAGEQATLEISYSGRPNAYGHTYIDLFLDGERVGSAGEEQNTTWRRTIYGRVHVTLKSSGTHTFTAVFNCGSGATSMVDSASEWPLGGLSWTVLVGG